MVFTSNRSERMARKSKELRLGQSKAILELLEAANIGPIGFVRDMIIRLERGKGLSPRMRRWLDQIIEDGVPAAKNPELHERITSLTGIPGQSDRTADILRDFANRAARGWDMSEKQVAFLEKLLVEAAELKKNGPWVPSPEMLSDLVWAVDIARGRSMGYWANRPGEAKSYRLCAEWLTATQNGTQTLVAFILPEWSCKKMLHSSRVALRELKNPSFEAGEIKRFRNENVLIIDGPVVHEDQACYHVLVDGIISTVRAKDLRKRLATQ
jgi:hypothetical protein